MYADKTFYNGRIYTMNEPGETVEAIVVYGGRIVYAGGNEEALKWPANETEDLGGAIVLPGFSDTHMHVTADCLFASYVDLGGAASVADVVRLMRERDDGSAGWLCGAGLFSERLAENRFPLRYELDEISVERPIVIMSHCGHINMINSVAIGLTEIVGRAEFEDECLDYYDDGEPNGILMEAAYGKYLSEILIGPWTEPAYIKSLVRAGLPAYSANGLTTLHAVGLISDAPPAESFDQYYELEKSGELPVRVVVNPSTDLPWAMRPVTGFGTDMVKLGARKIFLDGSMGGRTAALLEPYSDAPGETGVLAHTEEELTALFREAYEAGLEVSIHVIGDAAMERTLNAAEKVYPATDESDSFKRLAGTDRRLRIIHAMIIKPGHIDRIKRLPVILDVQPGFLHDDVHIAEDRLGAARLKYLMPFKTFIDNGILLTGGSDAPVDPPVPLSGIQCAVTRQDLGGFPEGGFVAEEALSVYEAVALYTKNAAYCSNEERIKGTISVGKFADFILIDRDIFEVEPSEISGIQVLRTVLGGDTKYQRS
ncbi:MAG: amidohydrolase [Clostridiales Family XIII bacterium]|jgi:predicted amidohydrolase YtcJ|nr:amidohydrolase [Clostridiales Family XIII bacterium]